VVTGLGGVRSTFGKLKFAPKLPRGITRISFTVGFHGQPVRIEINQATATYTLADGPPMRLTHHGRELSLTAGEPQTAEIPPFPEPERLSQPPGREPVTRAQRAATEPAG
jgi:alpha,alpha-trehalose phosphorylase